MLQLPRVGSYSIFFLIFQIRKFSAVLCDFHTKIINEKLINKNPREDRYATRRDNPKDVTHFLNAIC